VVCRHKLLTLRGARRTPQPPANPVEARYFSRSFFSFSCTSYTAKSMATAGTSKRLGWTERAEEGGGQGGGFDECPFRSALRPSTLDIGGAYVGPQTTMASTSAPSRHSKGEGLVIYPICSATSLSLRSVGAKSAFIKRTRRPAGPPAGFPIGNFTWPRSISPSLIVPRGC
jgi:hypothetical protein